MLVLISKKKKKKTQTNKTPRLAPSVWFSRRSRQIQSQIEYLCGFFTKWYTNRSCRVPRTRPKFHPYTVWVDINQVLCTHTHAHNFLGGFFNPRRRQTQASGSSVNCLGTTLLEGEVESLAWWFSCMGTATVTIHTNTHANALCVCVFVCIVLRFQKEVRN